MKTYIVLVVIMTMASRDKTRLISEEAMHSLPTFFRLLPFYYTLASGTSFNLSTSGQQ